MLGAAIAQVITLATILGSWLAQETTPTPPALEDVIHTDRLHANDWLAAAAIFLASIALAVVVRRSVRRVLERVVGPSFTAVMVSRLMAYLTVLVGLVYALSRLGVRVGPLLGAIGLSSLVLALALQKVAEDFVGAVILQTRRPFTIGETIELDDRTGRVEDIDARTVVMRALDGTIVRFPNSKALTSTITNLTRKPVRRSEIDVGVAYDTNLKQATDVIERAVAAVPGVLAQPQPHAFLQQFGDSSINFVVHIWHLSDVASQLQARHDAILAIHHALADAGITIAFPQMVVWSGQATDEGLYSDGPATWFQNVDDAEVPTESTSVGVKQRVVRWTRR